MCSILDNGERKSPPRRLDASLVQLSLVALGHAPARKNHRGLPKLLVVRVKPGECPAGLAEIDVPFEGVDMRLDLEEHLVGKIQELNHGACGCRSLTGWSEVKSVSAAVEPKQQDASGALPAFSVCG